MYFLSTKVVKTIFIEQESSYRHKITNIRCNIYISPTSYNIYKISFRNDSFVSGFLGKIQYQTQTLKLWTVI